MMQSTGSHLGPYEIVAPLGSGGMGEVYRARDARLQRDVAIKVLPASSSLDAAARERFQREARAVAALNHPHICALYDVGVHGSADYLVMELIEGQTLAARLMSGGSMTIDAALTCAIQVADALDTAHRAGIVHRDLKPGNVMLTKSGVKLLDFGLAKRVVSEPGSKDVADQDGAPPTASVGPTEQGQVMGTWPYMAPEQILGRPVDARTDVFAYGVMLYEMLAGRRPFGGSSGHAVMAAVLERTPEPVAKAAPAVPPSIDRVVHKCLAKDPDARWQTMHDLADELRWIRDGLDHEEPPVGRRAQTWRIVLPLTLIVGAVGVAAGLLLAPRPDPAPQAVVRFAIDATDFDTSGSSAPEISPDGRQVVFVGRPKAGGPARLLLHDLTSGLTRPLEATDGASLPFWSADGRSVAYVAGGELKRLDLPHGSPRTIARVQGVFLGAAWNRDGVMLVSYRYGLYRMPADGGTQAQVTALDRSRYENSHRWPQFLPDGQRFLYVARSGRPDQSSAYLDYLDGRLPVRLAGAAAQVRYAAGHLFFVRGTTLMAQALDPDAPALRGDPIPLADDVNKNATGLRARVLGVADRARAPDV